MGNHWEPQGPGPWASAWPLIIKAALPDFQGTASLRAVLCGHAGLGSLKDHDGVRQAKDSLVIWNFISRPFANL